MAQLGPLLWGVVQAAIKESVRAEVPCEGSTGEGFTSKFPSVAVAAFGSLMIVGLWFPDGYWPEVALRFLPSKEILPDAPSSR